MSRDLPSATVIAPPNATRTAGGEPLPPIPPPGLPPDAPPGFTLDREIGSGGMGVVYLARQIGLNRTVALKTVRPGTALDPRALIRFLAEAESVAAVRHPNVVEVYSFGEHAGRPYLALEYCPGGDLTTLSKSEQTRDANWFRRVAELMARVAEGVHAAHQLGIVHRDLKPANVLLAADGSPKVTDFGLAKRGMGSDLTHTTDVLGTPAYMAPEQASGRTKFVGPEADVWALGVMLYELLSGTRPFDAPTPLEVMAAVAKAEVPKLRNRLPTIPADLALVAHKCLSADPRDRYPVAGMLAADLRNWLDGKPVTARPAGVIESAVKWVKRNKRTALTGLGVLLVMATATGVSLGFGIDATEQRKQAEEATRRAEQEAEQTQQTLAKLISISITSDQIPRPSMWRLVDWKLNTDEQDALWEVVKLRTGHLPLVFIDDVTSREVTARKFGSRGEFLCHAAVGLDSRKRKRVQELVQGKLESGSLTPRHRRDLALGVVSSDLFTPTEPLIKTLVSAMPREELDRSTPWVNKADCLELGLANMIAQLPPEQAVRVCRDTDVLQRLFTQQWSFSQVLTTAARQLPPERTTQVLIDVIDFMEEVYRHNHFDHPVIEVAASLPPEQAAVLCGRLADVLIAHLTLQRG